MKIKSAIIGYGRNGSSMHAEPFEALKEEFELVAVCDIDPAAKKNAKKRFGCRTYSSYKQMLKKEDLDFAVIVTRTDQHQKMACDCLAAGINVLITKPWAKDAAEAKKMIIASKKSGAKLLPWLPARFGIDLKRIKEIIDGGAIGKVFQVKRLENTFGIRIDWQTESKYGGGYLLNWGPHMIDQPLQLTDSPVESVYGDLKQIINPGDVEDNFIVITKTEDGTTFISEFTIAAKGQPNWVVQGSKGTIFVYDENIEIHKITQPEAFDPMRYRNPVEIEVIKETLSNDVYLLGDTVTVYKHIAKALRGEEAYYVTPESALELSKLLDAVKKSSKSGKVVKLLSVKE